jgi:hypothetical protein
LEQATTTTARSEYMLAKAKLLLRKNAWEKVLTTFAVNRYEFLLSLYEI